MRIGNTNFFSASLFAQRALRNNVASQKKSIEKLATGKRINRAGDDAAGLSISAKLDTQIRGNRVAQNNILDAINMMETIDSGIAYVQNEIQDFRELVLQASNGTYSQDEIDMITHEFQERSTALIQNTINATYLREGKSILKITDLPAPDDYLHPSFELQIGANDSNLWDPELDANGIENRGIVIAPEYINNLTPGTMEFGSVALPPTALPEEYIPVFDIYLQNLNRMRSELGAKMNTLQSRFDYLENYNLNLLESKSRIMDTDFAAESSSVLKAQIQSQAASAVLSQANNQASIVLSLIPGGR